MATQSSPLLNSPPALPTAPEGTKPATYTTVGSLYNPQAGVPLQPPTRRSRACRFTSLYQSPSSCALGAGHSYQSERMTTASGMGMNDTQAYSPLQQNYDRAVGPMPVLKPGTGQSLHSSSSSDATARPLLGNRENALPMPRHNDGSDMDSNLPSRFNLKSLANLASYPNPAQNAARNALAKARPVNLDRTGTPVSFSDVHDQVKRGVHASSSPPHSTPVDQPAVSSMSNDSKRRPEPEDVGRLPPTGPRDPMERAFRRSWAGFNGRGNGFSTLSTGPGAPQPLKAGPPGHRQLGLLNIEDFTEKLQGIKETGSDSHKDRYIHYQPVSATNPSAALPVAQSSANITRESSSTGQHPLSLVDYSEPEHLSIAKLESEPINADFDSGGKAVGQNIKETLSAEDASVYYPHGLPLDYNAPDEPTGNDFLARFPLHRQTPRPLTEEQLAWRQTNIDNAFYAGTRLLGTTTNEAIRDLRHRHLAVGVIGGERRLAKVRSPSPPARATKVLYPPMGVEEANAEEPRGSCEQLLNMAFTTFVSYAEEHDKDPRNKGWRSGFVTPDADLIDDTEEGNKSFFGGSEKPEGVNGKPKTRS